MFPPHTPQWGLNIGAPAALLVGVSGDGPPYSTPESAKRKEVCPSEVGALGLPIIQQYASRSHGTYPESIDIVDGRTDYACAEAHCVDMKSPGNLRRCRHAQNFRLVRLNHSSDAMIIYHPSFSGSRTNTKIDAEPIFEHLNSFP